MRELGDNRHDNASVPVASRARFDYAEGGDWYGRAGCDFLGTTE